MVRRSGLLVAKIRREHASDRGGSGMQPTSLLSVRGRSAAMAIAAIALAACSKPPRQQAKQGLESLHSWAQSADMVGAEWLRGAVPGAYAGKALQSFAKKARKEQRKISSGALPAATRKYLSDGFGAVALSTDSLRSAIHRKDRDATAPLLAQLSARARAADSAKAQLGTR
jgi:hypothetical protein